MSDTDAAVVEPEHRQVHRPDSGDSECSCGTWVGPMTTLRRFDERSFESHLVTVVCDRMDRDPEVQAAVEALRRGPLG